MRRRFFRHTAQPTQAAAEAYFELVFFGNPWRDEALPSLVHEDASGAVTGFLGVVPRPMLHRGREVRLAVTTQFMAERGMAGIQLLTRALEGPQDLTFSDAANDTSRRIWEGLGGTTALVYSLYWEFPLRPVRRAASRLGQHPAARGLRLLTRPLVAGADVALRAVSRGRARIERPAGLRASPLGASDIVAVFPAIASRYSLVPVYDEATVRWLLDRLTERRGSHSLQARLVRGEDGQPLGWYLYRRAGIRAEVIQIAANPTRWGDVLRMLLVEAREAGLASVAGRMDPGHADKLAALGCAFRREGVWSLLHSRQPELSVAVLGGRAYLSRLDSEGWMNF